MEHGPNCDCQDCYDPHNKVYRKKRQVSFRRRRQRNKKAIGYKLRKNKR
jgi:hypothetical protein